MANPKSVATWQESAKVLFVAKKRRDAQLRLELNPTGSVCAIFGKTAGRNSGWVQLKSQSKRL
jgi:hypothetical protein